MKNTNKKLTLVAITEEELAKFNKIGDTYILYKTMFSKDIQIGFIDNYLSFFAPTFSNTNYLEFADGKAYFYDPDSSYEKFDVEDRPAYEISYSNNKTVSGYSIINGDIPLDTFVDNNGTIGQTSKDIKSLLK